MTIGQNPILNLRVRLPEEIDSRADNERANNGNQLWHGGPAPVRFAEEKMILVKKAAELRDFKRRCSQTGNDSGAAAGGTGHHARGIGGWTRRFRRKGSPRHRKRSIRAMQGAPASLRLLPSVDDIVNHGDVWANRQYPQSQGHAVGERSQDHQNQAFGTLPESHAGAGHERFGSRLGIADHYGARHRSARQKSIREAIHLDVVNEQAEKKYEICVPVKNRIQEGAEQGYPVLPPGDGPIEQIAQARRESSCRRPRQTFPPQKVCPPTNWPQGPTR